MADFVAQFSDEELCTIVRGEGMNSPRVTPGTAGAIGGVSDALQRYGLPGRLLFGRAERYSYGLRHRCFCHA